MQAFSLRRDLIENMTVQADIIAYNSTASLMFNDRRTAESLLATLEVNTSITTAYIISADGSIFASYNRDDDVTFYESAGQPAREEYYFDQGRLHIYKIIEWMRNN